MTPKWTENSICPRCNSPLYLRLFQKGFRLRCKKCRFKVYPQPGEISEEFLQRFLRKGVAPQIEAYQTHLNKYISSLRQKAILK
jgi:tRNA(Ile2) C34 agmatinyltransferase TiaS